MIIATKRGDLFQGMIEDQLDGMVHGCNCCHTMRAGIAKLVAEKFPGAVKADLRTQYKNFDKLGTFSYYKDEQSNKIIFNAYTQAFPGYENKKILYEAIKFAFSCLNQASTKFDTPLHLAIPKIGAGIAGGDWDEIEKIINSVTPDLKLTLYVI